MGLRSTWSWVAGCCRRKISRRCPGARRDFNSIRRFRPGASAAREKLLGTYRLSAGGLLHAPSQSSAYGASPAVRITSLPLMVDRSERGLAGLSALLRATMRPGGGEPHGCATRDRFISGICCDLGQPDAAVPAGLSAVIAALRCVPWSARPNFTPTLTDAAARDRASARNGSARLRHPRPKGTDAERLTNSMVWSSPIWMTMSMRRVGAGDQADARLPLAGYRGLSATRRMSTAVRTRAHAVDVLGGIAGLPVVYASGTNNASYALLMSVAPLTLTSLTHTARWSNTSTSPRPGRRGHRGARVLACCPRRRRSGVAIASRWASGSSSPRRDGAGPCCRGYGCVRCGSH